MINIAVWGRLGQLLKRIGPFRSYLGAYTLPPLCSSMAIDLNCSQFMGASWRCPVASVGASWSVMGASRKVSRARLGPIYGVSKRFLRHPGESWDVFGRPGAY